MNKVTVKNAGAMSRTVLALTAVLALGGVAGQVGETRTPSASLLSGAMLNAVEFNTAGAFAPLVDSALRLDGGFTITPVPEPEGWALLLAGLGLVAGITRRGRKNSRNHLVTVSL